MVSAGTNQQLEHHRVDLGGVKAHYVRTGDGPSVVLTHGLNASWFTWCRNLGPLAQAGYTVLDLPDHGYSDKPHDLGCNPAAGVEALNEFLDVLGLTKAIIVGNSVGGLVSGLFALNHPSKVGRLVMVMSAGLGRGVGWVLRPAGLPGARHVLLRLIRFGVNQFGQRKQIIFLDRLSSLGAPFLTVWGSEDVLIHVARAQDVNRALPSSVVHTIQNCGHWPRMERDAGFNNILITFVRGELDQPAVTGRPAL